MHIIDIQIMNVSKIQASVEDFNKLLELCKDTNQLSYSEDGLLVYFPEGLYKFPQNVFKEIQEIEDEKDNVVISPFICLSNDVGYVGIHTEGNDFIMDEFTVLTSTLLLLRRAYANVRLVDFSYDGESSKFLIKFNGYSYN